MEFTRRCIILRKTLLLTLICCSATCYTWHILSSYPVIDNRQHFISDVGDSREKFPYWSSETFKERDLKSKETDTSRIDISGARVGKTYTDAHAVTDIDSGAGTSNTRLKPHAKDQPREESQYHSAKPTSQNKLRAPPRWSGDYAVKTWLPRSIKADAPDGQDVAAPNVDAPGVFNVSGDMLRFSGGSPVKRLPQALIIGVKKCGTRALLEFLRLHPDIRATGPETHFFDRFYDRGLEWYRQQMPLSLDSQITMEKTPSYFITREVPRRLHQMSPSAKLVVVVRDPVTRAISDYTQTASKRGRPPSLSFDRMTFRNSTSGLVDTSWSAIRIGVYSRFLEWWTQYFSLRQIHFVSGENLIRDPAGEMARVQDFLGLKRVITDKHFYFNETKGFPCLKKSEGNGNPHCLGKTKGRTHPEISPSTVTRLRDFYRPFNLKFYQMVGRDFAWL